MTAVLHGASLLALSERLARDLPGHRVEIIRGQLTVTPPADGSHAVALTIGEGTLLEPGCWLTIGEEGSLTIGEGSFLNMGVMVAVMNEVTIMPSVSRRSFFMFMRILFLRCGPG